MVIHQPLYFYAYNIKFIIKHSTMPKSVGNIAAITVGLRPSVSFFMVMRVVAQGQWHIAKVSIHMAVFIVHPLSVRS